MAIETREFDVRTTTRSFVMFFVFICIVASAQSTFARGRYLNPMLGRYLTRDPIAEQTVEFNENDGAVTLRGFLSRDVTKQSTHAYGDGMSFYQYERSGPIGGLDPSGLKKLTYAELAKLIGGCTYPLPANATDFRQQQLSLITDETMMCLFWQESSFDTEAQSPQGYYGLGQLGEAACADVDRAYGLAPGTCWARQKSGDACSQIANSIGYLHHILTNPKDFGHDGTLQGGLKKYGPVDAPASEYAIPITKCGNCLKNAQPPAERGTIGAVSSCNSNKASPCLQQLNKDVQDARKNRQGPGR